MNLKSIAHKLSILCAVMAVGSLGVLIGGLWCGWSTENLMTWGFDVAVFAAAAVLYGIAVQSRKS